MLLGESRFMDVKIFEMFINFPTIMYCTTVITNVADVIHCICVEKINSFDRIMNSVVLYLQVLVRRVGEIWPA